MKEQSEQELKEKQDEFERKIAGVKQEAYEETSGQLEAMRKKMERES